jgi:hypothetical protein
MVSFFALLIVFVNGGGVRHVSNFWKEKIEASVAFRNVNGELKVVGINGIRKLIGIQHHMYFTLMVD